MILHLNRLLLILALLFGMMQASTGAPLRADGAVRVAVLAFRPKPEITAKWQPLIDYLNSAVPGQHFVLEALSYDELEQAVSRKQVDVVLTQPAHYILLTHRDGLLSPLASLVERNATDKLVQFGGVILTLAQRSDLAELADLRGKRIATSQMDSLGSFQMQTLELKRAGIKLPDEAYIVETGQPQDKAIEALLAGQVDVAFVRTGVLEAMVQAGRLRLEQVKVIHPVKPTAGFPFVLSTLLYPEWPLAVMPWLDEGLARQLAAAVLTLPHGGEVARQIGITGFTIPLDYSPVEALLSELRLPPFNSMSEITLQDVFQQYQRALFVLWITFMLLVTGFAILLVRNNRRLQSDKDRIDQMNTELEAYRLQLQTQNQRLQHVLDGSFVGTWEWYVQTGETVFNERWAEIVGYTLTELEPVSIETWKSLAHPDDLQRSSERLEAHFSGKLPYYECEARMRHKDGHWVWVFDRGRVATWTNDGQPLLMAGSHQDVTERKLAALELVKMKEAAEAANIAKSNFLATMSHEIRTPLNGILGMAQMLLSPGIKEEDRQNHARIIFNSGQTLLTLLNDILDFSKIEAGKIELQPTVFQPEQLLHETCELFHEVARSKGLRLEAVWHSAAEARYRADPTRLRQMLANLVGNAIKFTAQGFIRLEGWDVQTSGDESLLKFVVTDSGIGIPEDKQALLFKPFSQIDASDTRKYGGTGLGLSIVRSLVLLMRGDIGVDSTEGKGSHFWFRIRVQPVKTTDESRLVKRDAEPMAVMTHTQQFILVVEDNPVNREVVKAMLTMQGMDFESVENGQEAVDRIKTGIRPTLILMDCQMPVLDGYEATRQIRAWEQSQGQPRLPIIALTAGAYDDDRQRCLAAGMNDFLTKPVDLKLLVAAINKWGITSGNDGIG